MTKATGMSTSVTDGRWVVDDYYEEKVVEEITARGLKAGDPVGELPDPNATHHSNELSSLNAASNANAGNKADRGGGGAGGIYRAGGPTTIFGGSGWGPYSDGPLNAVRKSILSRDGVAEDNWMWMMATRVNEADQEWAKWRKESLKALHGVDGVLMGGTGSVAANGMMPKHKYADLQEEEEEDEEADDEENSAAAVEPAPKKRRVGFEAEARPLGIYEPHTNLIHCWINYSCDEQSSDLLFQIDWTPNQPEVDGNLSLIRRRRNAFWAAPRLGMVHGVWLGLTQSWNCPPLTTHQALKPRQERKFYWKYLAKETALLNKVYFIFSLL